MSNLVCPSRERMRRVSASRPCPVCHKPDWCLVATDGTTAICQRTEGAKRAGDAGWVHQLAEPVPPPAAGRKTTTPPKDWRAEAETFAQGLDAGRRAELAATLRLPVGALDALPLLGFRPDRDGGHFVFPETDARGCVTGLNRRFPDGTKKMMPGGRRGLTLPAGWRETPGPVLVVEGPTDAAAVAAAGLPAVGRPSNVGGVALLADLLADLGPDRGVIVVGENDRKETGDWPGRTGAESVARGLAARLHRPVRWALPPAGAKDVRDWLTADARGRTPWPDRGAELLAHLTAAAVRIYPPGEGQPAPDGRVTEPPCIRIGTDEHRVNAEAAAALAAEPDVYRRGGMLVHVVEAPADPDSAAAVRRPDPVPVVRDLAPPLLRERLTRCAHWAREVERGGELVEVPAHPPAWCVQAVHARGDWPAVRRLEAVVTHPAVLADGSVLAADGYDPRSGLLVSVPPNLAVAVPAHPTREEVIAARDELLGVVADFPFERPEHRAAWVAGLLTPLAWFAFDGPAPLFLIDKNVRGAGAGLLADVVALIVTGRRFPVMTYTPDREELRKKITSLAAEGERLVLLDNLTGAVGCDVLDAALTSDRWKDRLLGGNRVYDGPLHVCWFGTGNNVQLHADTARRVCHVRMETADERPELRTGFKYPDLRAHVRAERGQLLSAALTVLRGWFAAGKPRHNLAPWGSFEGWSRVVREAVVFAGLPDPGETRQALQSAADRDAGAMAALLSALERMDPDRRGVTTADILEAVKPRDPKAILPDWAAELRAAVEDLCGKLDGRALGYRFRHFQRRNFGGRMLDKHGAPHGSSRWVVLAAGVSRNGPGDAHHAHHVHDPDRVAGGDGGDGGDGGHDPAHPKRCERSGKRYRSDDRPHESRGW